MAHRVLDVRLNLVFELVRNPYDAACIRLVWEDLIRARVLAQPFHTLRTARHAERGSPPASDSAEALPRPCSGVVLRSLRLYIRLPRLILAAELDRDGPAPPADIRTRQLSGFPDGREPEQTVQTRYGRR